MTGITLRFVNFILDTFIYFIIIVVFTLAFSNIVKQEDVKWISILIYFLYYFIFEYFMKQTPAKMITKSKVISITGNNKHFFIQMCGRTLMRFIPLDILSYLFSRRGLHDWISKTDIVKL